MKLETLIFDYINNLEKKLIDLWPTVCDSQKYGMTLVEWKSRGQEEILRSVIHGLKGCLAEAEDIKENE